MAATDDMLSTSFDQCDTDKSGFLEKTEVIHVLEKYNASCPCKKANVDMDKQVKDFLVKADVNKDGKISKKEFIDYFKEVFKK